MGELALDVHGLSRHSNSDVGFVSSDGSINAMNQYNEVNPGLGLSYQFGDSDLRKGIIAGFYNNSINKQSNYLGGELIKRFGDKLFLDLGARGGVVTGYDGIKPMLMPFVGLGYGRNSFNLGYIPKIEGVTPETLTLSHRIRLGK